MPQSLIKNTNYNWFQLKMLALRWCVNLIMAYKTHKNAQSKQNQEFESPASAQDLSFEVYVL